MRIASPYPHRLKVNDNRVWLRSCRCAPMPTVTNKVLWTYATAPLPSNQPLPVQVNVPRKEACYAERATRTNDDGSRDSEIFGHSHVCCVELSYDGPRQGYTHPGPLMPHNERSLPNAPRILPSRVCANSSQRPEEPTRLVTWHGLSTRDHRSSTCKSLPPNLQVVHPCRPSPTGTSSRLRFESHSTELPL